MVMRTRLGIGCVAYLAMLGAALAQGDKPAEPATAYYKLDFVVKELDGGKTVNSRAYSSTISTDRGQTSIRTGTRIPIPARGEGSSNYVEVGINFDCRNAKLVGAQFAVNVSAEISSPAEPSSTPPVIRSNRWSGDVVVPLRKPTVVFSSDDAMSKRQMQLELTVTPLK